MYRDEAYILRSKAEDYDENEKKSIILMTETFLKMHETLVSINSGMEELIHKGYMIFRDDEKVLSVVNKDFNEIKDYHNKICEISQRWDHNLKIIYSNFSSKATMLGGPKLKDFYFLLRSKIHISEAEKFRHIASPNLIK